MMFHHLLPNLMSPMLVLASFEVARMILLDELRQIPSNTVEEIRYLSGTDAQTKYGPRFPAGVIEVTLKTH